jgi:uncharacterized repeat protein (TIGR03843 family)
VPGDERPGRTLTGDPALLGLLEEGDLRVAGLLEGASNHTFLAEAAGNGHRALVVYKPVRGETPLWDFREGTLARREVAAYRLAVALGWPRVPPTVLREGPFGIGAVQAFVRADPTQHYFTLREGRPEDFKPVAAFDVVANNADRKGGHCLLGEDDQVWVIDHGLCFHTSPKLRTVVWEFAGERLPEDLRGDLRRVAAELGEGPLAENLLGLLSEDEVEATVVRAERLAEHGRFPQPGPGRAVPWPPV